MYRKLWKNYKKNQPIPVLLELGQYIEELNKNILIDQGLKSLGLTEKDISQIQSNQKLILLLDGYDETGHKGAVYNKNNIGKWANKTIFTVRGEYAADDQDFVPYKDYYPQTHMCQKILITPFDK